MFRCTGYGDCEMIFTRSEHLARHCRKHTGERPFICHCGRAFSRLDNVRQHSSTVHSEQIQKNAETMLILTSLHNTLSAQTAVQQIEDGMVIGVSGGGVGGGGGGDRKSRRSRRLVSTSNNSNNNSGIGTSNNSSVFSSNNSNRSDRSRSPILLQQQQGHDGYNSPTSFEHSNLTRLQLLRQDQQLLIHPRHQQQFSLPSNNYENGYNSRDDSLEHQQHQQHQQFHSHYTPYESSSIEQGNENFNNSSSGSSSVTNSQLFSSEPLHSNNNSGRSSSSLSNRQLSLPHQNQQQYSNNFQYENELTNLSPRQNSLPSSSSSSSRIPYDEQQHHHQSYQHHQPQSYQYQFPQQHPPSQFQQYQQQMNQHLQSSSSSSSNYQNHSPILSSNSLSNHPNNIRAEGGGRNSITLPPISEILPLTRNDELHQNSTGSSSIVDNSHYSQSNHSNQTSPSNLSISLSDGRSSITSLASTSNSNKDFTNYSSSNHYGLPQGLGMNNPISTGRIRIGVGAPPSTSQEDYNSTSSGGGGGGSYSNLASYELNNDSNTSGGVYGTTSGEDHRPVSSGSNSNSNSSHRNHHYQNQNQRDSPDSSSISNVTLTKQEQLYQHSPFSTGPLILPSTSAALHLPQQQSQQQTSAREQWAPAPNGPSGLSSTTMNSFYEELRNTSQARLKDEESTTTITGLNSRTSTPVIVDNQLHDNVEGGEGGGSSVSKKRSRGELITVGDQNGVETEGEGNGEVDNGREWKRIMTAIES